VQVKRIGVCEFRDPCGVFDFAVRVFEDVKGLDWDHCFHIRKIQIVMVLENPDLGWSTPVAAPDDTNRQDLDRTNERNVHKELRVSLVTLDDQV